MVAGGSDLGIFAEVILTFCWLTVNAANKPKTTKKVALRRKTV
jgi:hypothetical protein